jgi:hypothetical protein
MGYKILLEVLVRGRWNKIADLSYSFHSRNAGVSKATMNEGRQFLRHVGALRSAYRKHPDITALPQEFVTTTTLTSREPYAPGEELFVVYGQRYDPMAAPQEEAALER